MNGRNEIGDRRYWSISHAAAIVRLPREVVRVLVNEKAVESVEIDGRTVLTRQGFETLSVLAGDPRRDKRSHVPAGTRQATGALTLPHGVQ